MVYEARAHPRGPYWAEEWSPREHCYSIVPVKDGEPRRITSEVWEEIFFTLGAWGYLFRDAGHDIEHAVVSLNKAIAPRHLRKLRGKLKITPNNGIELGIA